MLKSHLNAISQQKPKSCVKAISVLKAISQKLSKSPLKPNAILPPKSIEFGSETTLRGSKMEAWRRLWDGRVFFEFRRVREAVFFTNFGDFLEVFGRCLE